MSETEKIRDLKDLTHSQLVALRDRMLVDEWDDDLTPAQQTDAAMQLLRVQSAIRKLRKAQLDDIGAKLAANEDDLRKARREIADKVQGLRATASALDTIAGFLAVVGRVVTLVA
jgi:hypothetical protein